MAQRGATSKRAAEQARRILAAAAHDLKGPAGAIVLFTELLEQEPLNRLSSTQRELISNIRASSELVLQAIDDLLEFSAAETEHLTLALEPVDVLALANESIRTNSARASAKSVHLQLASHHPPVVQLDRQKMQRVINELLMNAIASSRPGQNVDLRVGTRKECVEISVHDEGSAIPSRALRTIFTPFSGEARPRTSVGLALAARIVDAHRGHIHARSQTGKGSTVVVSLPIPKRTGK